MKSYYIIILALLFGACKPNDATDLLSVNNSKAIYIADSLINISEQSNLNQFPDKYTEEALSLALQADNKQAAFDVYIYLAKGLRGKSNYAKSLEYLQMAQQIAEDINSEESKAYVAHETAVNFRRINDYATALKYHTKALEWSENVKDTFLMHCSLNGIGNVYFNYEDWDKAIHYFHQSLKFTDGEKPNLLGKAINTNTIGEAWLELNNTDSALHYLELSLQINVQRNSDLGRAICYNGIGMVYHRMGDFKKAEETYNLALNIYNGLSDKWYKTMCFNNLGLTQYETSKFVEAEKTLLESYDIASGIGSKNFSLEAAVALADLYKKWNKSAKAFGFHKIALQYKDSITNELKKQNAEAMKIMYDAERQKRQMLVLKQDVELTELRYSRQKYLFLSIAGFLVIVIAIVFFIYRHQQLNEKINKVKLEQRLLRTQLNPHFIFNSLSAIQNFIVRSDKDSAGQYLANFSRLMRNILMGSTSDFISVAEELKILDDYLALQKLRFLNKFNYSFHTDNQINTELCLIPSMLIQPFVENSVEHGLRQIDRQGEIFVRFKRQEKNLIIEVEDNGAGFTKEGDKKQKKHVSMATKIIEQRLRNLEKTHKQKCSFAVTDKKTEHLQSGVFVRIQLPYLEDD